MLNRTQVSLPFHKTLPQRFVTFVPEGTNATADMELNGSIGIDEDIFDADGSSNFPSNMLYVEIETDFKLNKSFLQDEKHVTDENMESLFPVDEETKEMTAEIFDSLVPPLPKEAHSPLVYSDSLKRSFQEDEIPAPRKKAKNSQTHNTNTSLLLVQDSQEHLAQPKSRRMPDSIDNPVGGSSNLCQYQPHPARPRLVLQGNPKPKHVCQECGKVFKRAHNLKIHGRLHSGDKPYSCPFAACGKEFRWKSSIVSHLNWHRTKRGDVLPDDLGPATVKAMLMKGSSRTTGTDGGEVERREVLSLLKNGSTLNEVASATEAEHCEVAEALVQDVPSSRVNYLTSESIAQTNNANDGTPDLILNPNRLEMKNADILEQCEYKHETIVQKPIETKAGALKPDITTCDALLPNGIRNNQNEGIGSPDALYANGRARNLDEAVTPHDALPANGTHNSLEEARIDTSELLRTHEAKPSGHESSAELQQFMVEMTNLTEDGGDTGGKPVKLSVRDAADTPSTSAESCSMQSPPDTGGLDDLEGLGLLVPDVDAVVDEGGDAHLGALSCCGVKTDEYVDPFGSLLLDASLI